VLSDHIGIHTDQPIDPIPLKTDLCMGHVLQQTCIMLYNYGTSKLPDKYAFIIHPIPKEFSGIHADLNIIELEEEQKKLLQNAIENEQTSVDTGFNSYPTHLLTQEQGLMDSILVHDIESYQYQKLKRDIVIKLVPYKATMKEIYYLVKFVIYRVDNSRRIFLKVFSLFRVSLEAQLPRINVIAHQVAHSDVCVMERA